MTDKEAYELLVKYSGEAGLVLIQEMIHIAGVEKALENMEWSYAQRGKIVDEEFKSWMRQAFNYMQESTKEAN